MKQSKKWMLVVLALLAVATVALPLVGCKHDADEAHTHSFDWEVQTESTETEKGTLVKNALCVGMRGRKQRIYL